MDLTPGQQKAVFAVVVVVLAGLGIYLLATPHGGNSPSASKSPTPSAAPSTPAQAAGSPSAAAAPQPSASGSVNIYQWLPFTQQALGQAVAVATQVTRDYNTFTYTENASAYLAPMNGLITSQLSQTLRNGYSTLGVAQNRTNQKQVSSGGASISSIRAFGSGSIVFVVNGTQKLTSTQGTTTSNNQYAVTVTNQGSSWQVYDIEPASAGNT